MTGPTPGDDGQTTTSGSGTLWLLLLGLVLAAVVAAAWWLAPVLRPELAQIAPLNPDCDLTAAPCTVTFPGGAEVGLEVAPSGIPLVTPLTLDVQVHGLEPSRVQVDFAGYDMDMGFNRTDLRPAETPGHYTGSSMLPVCVRARMTWEARVLLQTPRGLLAAPFRFDTDRSRGVPATE